MFAILFSLITFNTSAQNPTSKIPRWVSDKGYRVVECNINSPMDHMIRFYYNENELLCKENWYE